MRWIATTICLWIAAVTLAVSVGGNLFQAIVIDPVWSASPPESAKSFASTPYFGRLKTFHTNPIFAIGLACLLASPFLAWNSPGMRAWLLAAAGCYLLVTLVTLLYFWPINNALLVRGGEGLDATAAARMARHWLIADRIRYAFRMASFLCMVRAMVVSGASLPGR